MGNVGCCGFLSQTLATNPGTSYRISLFLNSNGTTPNEFDVEWNGATLFDQIDIPNTGGYEQLTFTAVETGSDTLTLSERNDPDYLALDDVSVTAPEPASLTLLGVALLGFGVLRRRSRRA